MRWPAQGVLLFLLRILYPWISRMSLLGWHVFPPGFIRLQRMDQRITAPANRAGRPQKVRWTFGSEEPDGAWAGLAGFSTWVGAPCGAPTRELPLLQMQNLRFANANRAFSRIEKLKQAWLFSAQKNPVLVHGVLRLMWSHLGSNQGPSDYESDALTN